MSRFGFFFLFYKYLYYIIYILIYNKLFCLIFNCFQPILSFYLQNLKILLVSLGSKRNDGLRVFVIFKLPKLIILS